MSRFTRILLFAGVPLGAAVALVTALASPVSWLDLGATLLAAGLALAGTLAWVTQVFLTRVRRSGWTTLLFIVSMSLAGLIAGVAVYALASWLPHGRWTRIAAPAEPIREFTGPTCYRVSPDPVVFARARSGHLYAYARNVSGDGTWVSTDEPSPLPDALCDNEVPRQGWTPLKPGPVVAARQIDFHGVDCGGRTHFLLLEDGTMWRWSVGGCAIGEVMFFLGYLVLVLLVSLLVAGGVLVLPPPFGWAKPSRDAEPVAT